MDGNVGVIAWLSCAGNVCTFGQDLSQQGVTAGSLLAFSRHFSNFEALRNAYDIEGWSADGAAPCSGNNSLWTGVLCQKGMAYGLNFTDVPLNGEAQTTRFFMTA